VRIPPRRRVGYSFERSWGLRGGGAGCAIIPPLARPANRFDRILSRIPDRRACESDFPDFQELNDELPDDIADDEKYVAIPDERKRPRTPQDLTEHNCINLRLPTHGGSPCAWEFEKNGRELNVRVEGLQPAYLTEGHVQPYLANGSLVRVLSDWCPPFSGYHLYYPSRRQSSPAFTLLVDALTLFLKLAKRDGKSVGTKSECSRHFRPLWSNRQ
jgi:DNA-binding transcriptional LysR family regulator